MNKKEIIYNKLIRDKIPEITLASSWISKTRKLGKKEFIKKLKRKILEEVTELNQAKDDKNLIEELIDIQEIIDTILSEKNVKPIEFKKMRQNKNSKRGGFKKRLFLIKTIRK